MTKTRALLVILAAPLLLAADTKTDFKEFKSEAGKFKVLIPGTPKEKAQPTPAGKLTMYVLEEKDGGYMVGFMDLPGQFNQADAKLKEVMLDGAAKGAAANTGTLVKQTSIKLDNKYPGREVLIKLRAKDGKGLVRIYIVNQRMYMVMSVGMKSWVESPDTKKFLDSFALLK